MDESFEYISYILFRTLGTESTSAHKQKKNNNKMKKNENIYNQPVSLRLPLYLHC